ncbi:unnamed protein product [Tilletia controversa]|uniref:F-box domain-containing protein n=1 Tax=Tilletia controversa TaxID=13291 RepID=A0A8X7SW40_9BASI|nr:hypothetical protein CF328_g6990 [Tilletia controversa]KAE8188856.1 hypothetical protein CF335_g6773 [Tilletia laevis]KAE8245690.1 hypothetical protein A4X06_0g5488 [Tilletia controversa]CAD6942527.1 unnamed protein product [Tilletia controversa]CAD6972207.1 unnamed protein product [Tilletia controversa]
MADDLQDTPPATVTVARATDRVSPPARSAVASFFETPELILTLLEHLHQDRIDLLAVAAVCKQLRTLALQVWIRHFEFDFDTFEGKLKLVQANSNLLSHIRCLRIANCEDWFLMGHVFHQRPPSFWTKVESLFSLLAARLPPYAPGPLLDILIDTEDSEKLLRVLQPHPRFMKRITALRLGELNSSPGCWTALTLLLKGAVSAATLRVLEYQGLMHPRNIGKSGRTARQAFWTTAAHQSLHELSLSFFPGDTAAYMLWHSSFTSLKKFTFTAYGSGDGEPLDNSILHAFLHRQTGLQELNLEALGSEPWPLVLDQSFPALHTLQLGYGISPSDEITLEFLRRHPGIRQFWMMRHEKNPSSLRGLLSVDAKMYKHLPGGGNTTSDELSILIKSGARPLRAQVTLLTSTPASCSNSDDTRFVDLGFQEWDGIRPENFEDLTYLWVMPDQNACSTLLSKSRQLFANDLLPALTELHFQVPLAVVDTRIFNDFFCQLTSATSLRILYMNANAQWPVEAEPIPAALLAKHVFPIRFELLCWRPRMLATKYYRFVADKPEEQGVAAAAAAGSGKMGRLQAVPKRTVLTQVSKDGIWHEKDRIGWAGCWAPFTVLDHNGDAASPRTR